MSPTVGKFCTPLKPACSTSRRKRGISRNGSVPQTPARTGVSLDDRQHLAGHVHDDRVGVAVGHQAGERAAAGHPVAARVVDDDQVGAAGLGELGRQPGAGACADDHRPPLSHLGAQRRQRLLASHRFSWTSSCRRSATRVANAGSLTSVSSSCSSTRPPRCRAGPRTGPRRPRGRGRAGLDVDHRDAAQRHEQHGRRPAPVELLGNPPSELGVLRGGGAHERDRRVVDVQFAVRERSGTVSRAPKLTMSSAPSETTWGTPAAPAASRRSGPAESTPPTRSSASSVVVRSSTPARKPPSLSPSIACPPGARGVKDQHLVAQLLQPLARAGHHGVVTPNIVAPTSGRASAQPALGAGHSRDRRRRVRQDPLARSD